MYGIHNILLAVVVAMWVSGFLEILG